MIQPTIKEVAQLAGVSPMTVSRTLDGGLNVRPEMQERVHLAVAQLGYKRNEVARSMRPGHRSGLIGVAITNLGNPYYGNFAQGVEEIAWASGRRILLGNTGEDLGRERQLVADFIGRQVEGLIVVASGNESEHLSPDALHQTPLVLASRSVDGFDADQVLLDDIGGSRRGTELLLNAGHRRIAFLGTATSVATARRRYEGFRQAFEGMHLEPDADIVRAGQQDVGAARAAMAELLRLPSPPTAVFAANNRNAIGALEEIGAVMATGEKVRFPAILSFDNFELAGIMPVPVTIIDHDPQELGRAAASLLMDRVNGGGSLQFRQIEMPTHVHSA